MAWPKFLSLKELYERKFIKKWVDTHHWINIEAFLDHFLINVIYGAGTTEKLRHIVNQLELFESPLDLVSHLDLDHKLPTDIFVDQLTQRSRVPTVVKPPKIFLQNRWGYSNFTYNIYQNLAPLDPDATIFDEKNNEDRIRNRACLLYSYGALYCIIQDHYDSKESSNHSNNDTKLKLCSRYLSHLLEMISKDSFEIAGNAEFLTERDRIEFSKFNLVKLLIDRIFE